MNLSVPPRRLFDAIAPLLLVAACERDDAEPLVPPTPPRLAVAELRVVGGQPVNLDAPCVELGEAGTGTVLLTLAEGGPTSLGDWILRGPGACTGIEACGFLRATVGVSALEEEIEVLSTTSTLSLPLAALFAHASGEERSAVNATVTISLLGNDGFAVWDAEGARVALSFDLVLAAPEGCAHTPPPFGSAGGGGGAAGAGPGGGA